MIELTFTTLFLLYLSATVLMILIIWVYFHYRKKDSLIFPDEEEIFTCEYCHFTYEEEKSRDLNRCPQCGLLNRTK